MWNIVLWSLSRTLCFVEFLMSARLFLQINEFLSENPELHKKFRKEIDEHNYN